MNTSIGRGEIVPASSKESCLPLTTLVHILAISLAAFAWGISVAAAPLQLLSQRDSSVVPPSGGSGDSVDASVSQDGRFVVFSSTASDLNTNDNRQTHLNLFLRDRTSNTTVLVSANLAGTGGGDGNSFYGQVSTNGRYVVFESEANDLATNVNWTPNDINWFSDIFRRDLVTGTTELVSAATNGLSANNRSWDATMTPDGRYVTFVSAASNLVPGDNNGIADVFVRDMQTHITSLVSVGAFPPNTAMATPQITPDGRFVAFSSVTTITVGNPGITRGEVYVRDLVDETTTWVSVEASNIVASILGSAISTNCSSHHPQISDDGQFIAFKAGSSSITNPAVILVYNRIAGTTTIISTNTPGSAATDENRFGPEITPDRRFTAYVQREPGTNATSSSVHVWDSQTMTDTLVSGNADVVQTNSTSHTPVLSSDGHFVTFLSDATNLVSSPVQPGFHVYIHDIESGTTSLVDSDMNGVGSTDVGKTIPSISSSGRWVVFDASDGNLVNHDRNNFQDVFARDAINGTNELISCHYPGFVPATGNGITRLTPYSISADGRWVAFSSFADDLVTNDVNNASDVFLRNLWTGETILVSDTNTDVSNACSYSPAVSADGRYVAYVRETYNGMSTGNTNNLNVFRWDRATGSNVLVSVSLSGTPATGDCYSPIISLDGRYIVFLSSAGNLAAGTLSGMNTFWRDMNRSTNVLLSSGITSSTDRFVPSMSEDGRYVAYLAASSQLKIRDTTLGTDVYTNTEIATAAISSDGMRILYKRSANLLSVDSVVPKSALFSLGSTAAIQSSHQWSADSRYVVLCGYTNSASPSQANNVFLYDLATSDLKLVSFNPETLALANGPSDMPVISGDGRFVTYRSFATDIVANDTNSSPKIFLFDTSSGSNSILSAAQTDSSASPWISAPVISSGAENVAFLSIGSDLVRNDPNRVPDAFAVRILFRVQIAQIVTPGENVALTWQIDPARNYSVQYKDDLNDPQWHPSDATISVAANQATALVSPEQPGRFYRVIELP